MSIGKTTNMNDKQEREIVICSNKLEKEQLRQFRTKFNLACTLILTGTTFCFTVMGLFGLGEISQEAMLKTVETVSRIVAPCWQLIENSGKKGEKDKKKK